MNKFIGIGRLIKENELRYTTSNTAVVKNTIAIKRNRKNANGEYDSDFINVTAFGNNAELLSKYFSKGDMIAAEGRIETGSYKKNDETVYTTDLMIEHITFVGTKSKESKEQPKEEHKDSNIVELGELELPF